MAIFVINEWLWSDLSGSNGQQAQRETFAVIESLPKSNHQIVVIEGSSFDRKAWALCRNDNPMIVQRIGGLYAKSIRQDSERCLILKPDSVLPLPEELARAAKLDDHYLLQALISVAGAILVTTDEPLRNAARAAGLDVLPREECLSTYV